MKIAYILSTCAKSGPFIVAQNIINNISADLIDIYYLKESSEKLNFNGNCIKVAINQKIDLSKYDIVHSHGFLGDLYAYINRKSISGKHIVTLHQDIKTDYAMNYNRFIATMLETLWCKMISKSDTVVTLTQQMVNYYCSKIKTPITFVYNGISPNANAGNIPLTEQQKISKLKSNYFVLGISANLIYRKGIDAVINALTLPGAEKLGLLVLGDGNEKDGLLSLAQKLGVDDRCMFLGYKENAIDYFQYFDLYMMSSRSEGFGLCVIEAASQHIPVVCNNLPVYSELFSQTDVVRFELCNPESIIEAVNYALENKQTLSDNIFRKYQSLYTAKKMANDYMLLYTTLSHPLNNSKINVI